jgi:hypothetical protein
MSLLYRLEIQYLKDQKHVSKSFEYKLKSIFIRKVSAILHNEYPLLTRCPFMDFNALKSHDEGWVNFSLAHKICPKKLSPTFVLTVWSLFGKSKHDILDCAQKLMGMICERQGQRRNNLHEQ